MTERLKCGFSERERLAIKRGEEAANKISSDLTSKDQLRLAGRDRILKRLGERFLEDKFDVIL